MNFSDHETNVGNTYKDHGQFNFAWNAMAGASFDLTDDIKLDANYRFVSLGKARSGKEIGGTNNPIKFDNLYAHDFRLGLRYDLN